MFGLFKRDPIKKLQARYDELAEAAMLKQRNGDMRAYAELTAQAEAVSKELDALKQNKA